MNWLVQIGGATAISTVLITLINVIMTRRKTTAEAGQLSADATKIITDAAGGVVAQIREDNARLRSENADLRRSERMLEARVDDLEEDAIEWRREREEWRRVLMVHAAWDAMAVTAVRKAIPPIDLPDVPPLTPPVSARSPLPRVHLSDDEPARGRQPDDPSEPIGP